MNDRVNSGIADYQKWLNKERLHTKLKGQRLGQALWNALDEHVKRDIGDSSEALTNHEMLMTLWNISDQDLRKLLNDYLREL